MDNWLTASAADLGRGIGAGEIDPIALTEAYLEAIDAHEYADRIFARVTHDRARAEAKASALRAKAATRRSLLDGVPISWKDLFDTAGVATEAGSALLAGRVPERDAHVLQLATEAGLVCLGKTHTTELAFSGLGLNPSTASPPNIHDPSLVSGGSSSGAATSVAYGLAAIGIGSDTGGSVRAPAAWNDLVGLKTVHGRLSLDGVVPLCPRFDTVGPLCRTVEDAAHMLAVMSNSAAPDLESANLNRVMLANLQTSATENLRDGPREAYRNAVQKLVDAGAKVIDVEIPAVAEAMALAGQLFAPEAYATWRHLIEAHPDKMYAPVRERFQSGGAVSAPDYIAAWQKLDQLRAAYTEATSAFDAVILPTVPILPPEIEAVSADAAFFTSENLLTLQNTRIGNLMGLAGLTVPTGTPSCGLLLQGPSEERLLRLGVAVEAALT